MLLDKGGRFSLAAIIVALLALCHAGCSDQSVHYATDSSTPATAAVQPTSQPPPNPDQAAGLITRFYRDMDNAAMSDVATVVSPDFTRTHHDDLMTDYGFIHDPKVEVRSVHDRVVSYTMDYVYVSVNGGKFFWERSGRWTLNHGAASGWVLDNDTWDSIHLVGIELPNQMSVVPVHDTVYDDGRHEFSYEGARFAFVANESGWHVTTVAMPTPPPAFDPDTAVPATDTTTADSTDATDTAQTPFDDAQTAQAKCPSDIVVWVNTRSGVFHMPGTRWYGMTKNGTYECETDALAEGDRQSRNGQ
ncbi:MAG TPA: hypothetical protein VGZ00_06975 [Candidatus Baltobacteraceae bacterium]|jgi:hypothetical protein|nr:hypothetical protein [Candidatus Baltobacteraceae bacterium]